MLHVAVRAGYVVSGIRHHVWDPDLGGSGPVSAVTQALHWSCRAWGGGGDAAARVPSCCAFRSLQAWVWGPALMGCGGPGDGGAWVSGITSTRLTRKYLPSQCTEARLQWRGLVQSHDTTWSLGSFWGSYRI